MSADTTAAEGLLSAPMLVRQLDVCAAGEKDLQSAGGIVSNCENKKGATALDWAVVLGHLPCLQLLLDAGAKVNTQDILGDSPLMHAVLAKKVECARALLPASDLASTNLLGQIALHVAVSTASEAGFELLLSVVSDVDVRTLAGVDGNGQPSFNKTALHLACEKGQLPMCKALLSRGADRMARDNKQNTPLHWAAVGGHLSCVVMLVGGPGRVRMTPDEVDAVDVDGWTALHMAAIRGFDQICGVLLGVGAQLETKASDGFTPLMLAQHHQPTNVALLALLSGAGTPQPLSLMCDHCGKAAEEASVKSLGLCRDCRDVRYCSKECQAVAWPGHRAAYRARVKERVE